MKNGFKDKHNGAVFKGEALLRLAKRAAAADCFCSFTTDENQQVDLQYLSISVRRYVLRHSVHTCQYRQTDHATSPNILSVQGEYKLSEDFAKQYFHKY
jgi:hypothetical protein